MDLKEARYILAIAHYKSIGKAAKALFISQPSQIPQESGTAAWLPPLFPSGTGIHPYLYGRTLSILCRTDRSLWPGMGSGI